MIPMSMRLVWALVLGAVCVGSVGSPRAVLAQSSGGAVEAVPLAAPAATPPGDLGAPQPLDAAHSSPTNPSGGASVDYPMIPSPPQAPSQAAGTERAEPSGSAAATELTDEAELVAKAKITAESMFSDPNYPALLNLTMRARAILIVPNLFKAGFFIGGRGGNGVLVVRDPSTKQWGTPAFFAIGGVSYGLQFGAQDSEVILVIMSEKGLKALVKNEFTLGGDAGMAVANIGMGAQAATGLGISADVYSFARSGGLYAGLALDGSVITAKDSWNKQVYGSGATPEAILLERRFAVPDVARPLIAILP